MGLFSMKREPKKKKAFEIKQEKEENLNPFAEDNIDERIRISEEDEGK